MESQPKNPEFRINPENLHPCLYELQISSKSSCVLSLFIWIQTVDEKIVEPDQLALLESS